MKLLKSFLIFLTSGLCLVPQIVYSSTQGDGNPSGTTILIKDNGGKITGGRPRVPSNQQVCCSYANGLLTIAFKYAEGNCEVALTDVESGIEAFYTIDSEELSATIFVGEVGELFVEISTENGNIYSGTLIP